MSVIFCAGAAVLISALASHAFHSWLRLRERERLSATDKAMLEGRLDDLDRFRIDVKNGTYNRR